MAGHHKWEDIRRRKWEDLLRRGDVSPEAEAEGKRNIEEMQRQYDATLAGLRRARALTREQLAQQLGASEEEISRFERQADLYLATVQRFAGALGGHLRLEASFENLA